MSENTVPRTSDTPLAPEDLARVVARDIPAGSYVNLGIGQPTLVSNYLSAEDDVTLHTENGMLGMGPFPYEGEEDADLINAGKQTITELPHSAYFDSAQSFAMIRGGHIDLCVLGAFEVASNGDIANWATSENDRKSPRSSRSLAGLRM